MDDESVCTTAPATPCLVNTLTLKVAEVEGQKYTQLLSNQNYVSCCEVMSVTS